MKNIILLVSILAVILAACAPAQSTVPPPPSSPVIPSPIASQTPYPTYTLYPSLTPYPTYTLMPSQTPQIFIVTVTFTVTPKFTSTITKTASKTIPPTTTPDPLKTMKAPGYYLVGKDIAPGIWRSQNVGNECYWEVTTQTGDIISNHFGQSGGTIYIPATSFQVRLEPGCGNWTFLQ
jgi:hypothetical protein